MFLISMKKTTKTKLQKQKYHCQHEIIEKTDKNYLPHGTCFKTETSYNLSRLSGICDQDDLLKGFYVKQARKTAPEL